MNFVDRLTNLFWNRNRYRTDSEAVVISCFYNPYRNPYRVLAFNKWYQSVKHLNYRVIECVIENEEPQLPLDDPNIIRVNSNSVLWHKEALLNHLIKQLPEKFKYVFWVDADVLFSNKNWLVEATQLMRTSYNMIQPFQSCFHLNRDELSLSPYDEIFQREYIEVSKKQINSLGKEKRSWYSFGYNCVENPGNAYFEDNYDIHGHVGFAWGIKREILDKCPLFDKALVGGADHIMAHAALGELCSECIRKSFTEMQDEISSWSKNFFDLVDGKVGYVSGDLFHIWHGDLTKRQYLKRVKEFTKESKEIKEKDSNGLYKTHNDKYVRDYLQEREYIDNFHFNCIPPELLDDFAYNFGYSMLDYILTSDELGYQEEYPEYVEGEETVPLEQVLDELNIDLDDSSGLYLDPNIDLDENFS